MVSDVEQPLDDWSMFQGQRGRCEHPAFFNPPIDALLSMIIFSVEHDSGKHCNWNAYA